MFSMCVGVKDSNKVEVHDILEVLGDGISSLLFRIA